MGSVTGIQNRVVATAAFVLVAAGLVASAQEPQTAAPRITIAELGRAWEARQKAFRAVQFRWHESVTHFKGMSTAPSGIDYPGSDVTFQLASTLCFHNDDFRFEATGTQYEGRVEAFVPMTTRVSFHNGRERNFFGTDDPDELDQCNEHDYPIGFESVGKTQVRHVDSYYPLMLHVRPTSPAFRSFDLKVCRILPSTAKIGNVPCVVLRATAGPYEYEYWLDPALACVVRRYQVVVSGQATPHLIVDIEYRQDQVHGAVPARWTSKSFMGKQTSQVEAILDACEVGSDVPRDGSDFAFPPGTKVRHTTETEDRQYLVQSDGSNRPITKYESSRGVSYQTLRTTQPDYGPGGNGFWRYFWIVVVIGLPAGIVCWLAVRRLRVSRA